jgi:putative membrane protein
MQFMQVLLQHLLAAFVFVTLGLVVLTVWFWLIVKFAPFAVVREIEQDQNTALGIIIGAIIIGVSLIIAAAIGPS